ncbi:hypothetical protein [Gemmatimonas sp.]|jgi:hypothetical protein|uniref:hypothetical protein n=1 Tax=Gemmatimonas sp. TaxID=1962908 RepID=UPI0037BF68B6
MSELSAFEYAETPRFRTGLDWFVISHAQDVTCIRIGATAERVVDMMHALSVYLDPAVDLRIDDARTGRRWQGALLALPEVRETIGRLRLPLAAYGGVEVSLFTDNDQLTLTPEMLIVIYARTDRWAFLLDGMGLLERTTAPAPNWMPLRSALRAEPQLAHALQAAADRLGLIEEPHP